MGYRELLQAINTEAALNLLGIEYERQGAYLRFKCSSCGERASIKVFGDKKNLFYCPKCRNSGHIISIVMRAKGVSWQDACQILFKAKASTTKITEELKLNYELQYHKFLEGMGITEHTCKICEIGVPKGKTMLSGCVAFTIVSGTYDRTAALKIAYYGIRMKDKAPVFHKSFNPEAYLYILGYFNPQDPVYFTTDMFECVKMFQEQKQAMCNFGLPYLSPQQLEEMRDIPLIIFKVQDDLVRTFALQMAENHMGFHMFD